MKKTLYIAEFSREDSDNESIWFVGNSNLEYKAQEELAYKHLAENVFDDSEITFEECLEDAKDRATIEGVYTIPQELIKEVYESYQSHDDYSLEKDHAEIKKQIKSWEVRIDKLINNPDDQEALKELEDISHEMMSINI